MSTWRRLLTFLRPHRGQIVLAIALGCATIAANVGLLATAAYLVAAAALRPLLIALAFPMYLVRVLGVSRAFLRYGERLLSHRVTLTLLADLRLWLFRRIAPLVPAALVGLHSGDLLARMTTDVEELEHVYVRVLAPVLVAILVTCTVVGVLAFFSPSLALAAALLLVAAGIGVPLLALALARGLGARQLAIRAALHDGLVDGIQGMQDLLAFGRAEDHARRLADLEAEAGRLQSRMARVSGLQAALGDLLSGLGVWTILILAIPLVSAGRIGGVYLAFLALLLLGSFEAVVPLGQAFGLLGRSLAAAGRLFAIADATPAVADPVRPVPVPPAPSLAFADVCFAYDSDDGLVLDRVSLRVEPGQWVAVVGPSGAGKSTLAHLALRFWDPDRGAVRLGERDLREYRLDDLHAAITMVGQQTDLFTDTLRNNLRLARPHASDGELIEALEAAQLGDLLDRLPSGLDGWLGEGGLTLSGGERQRLAVARALLREAPIVVLDEPTANLDPITEQRLLAAVAARTRDRAVLLISHRLVAMERMAEIVVLDRGRIVQHGMHVQLRAMPGLYQQMLDAQDQLLSPV